MDGSTGRLLVVQSDPWIAQILSRSLSFAGFDVMIAKSGADAVTVAEQHRPDVAVVDVGLADLNGFEVVRQLRQRDISCPVVFLLTPDDLANNPSGLTIGGDDYLLKPFSLDEVETRVQAVLRRVNAARANGAEPGVLRFADLEFDEDTQEVRRAGRRLRLAPMERRLLRYLLRNVGTVVSRAQILEHVWPYESSNRHNRALDVHICTLRRKIDRLGPPLIHTIYGVGYSLRLPSADEPDHADDATMVS